MWDWLDDHRYYLPALWGLTTVFLILPFAAWFLYPTAAWWLTFGCLYGLLSAWNAHLASPENINLAMGAQGKSLSRIDAIFVRLRIASFGAVTSILGILAALYVQGYDIFSFLTSLSGLSVLGLVVMGVPASIFSTHITVWMLACWKAVSEFPLNLASIWIALTMQGYRRVAAFQKLYDIENKLFVAVAGYRTSFTFRSDMNMLRGNFPEIGK